MVKETEERIRIMLAEDHEVVRCGLKGILNQHQDLEVIAEASSCKEVLTYASTFNPDVILLDLTLTDGNSLASIPILKDLCPSCKILVFTASIDKEIHINALRYGAVGILLKSQTAELICKAIRSVYLNDELWIDQTLIAEMWKQNTQVTETIESANKPTSPVLTSSLSLLTHRENQIACLSSKGITAKKISKELCISEKTVRNHLTVIYGKLGVKNQLELSINSNIINVYDK